jgi:hypothetical protein
MTNNTNMSRIEIKAFAEIAERPRHFQLVIGGMRTIRSLTRRGLVVLGTDLYVHSI